MNIVLKSAIIHVNCLVTVCIYSTRLFAEQITWQHQHCAKRVYIVMHAHAHAQAFGARAR